MSTKFGIVTLLVLYLVYQGSVGQLRNVNDSAIALLLLQTASDGDSSQATTTTTTTKDGPSSSLPPSFASENRRNVTPTEPHVQQHTSQSTLSAEPDSNKEEETEEVNGRVKDSNTNNNEDETRDNRREALLNLPKTGGMRHHERLELVHIPKTGGTALEIAAAQMGIPWSFCHHKIQWEPHTIPHQYDNLPTCPDFVQERYAYLRRVRPFHCAPWHMPPCMFMHAYQKASYYDDAALFAVVRNPYQRVISEYKYHNRDTPAKVSASGLNRFVEDTLSAFADQVPAAWRQKHACQATLQQRVYFKHSCHNVPQVDYVYGAAVEARDDDDESTRMGDSLWGGDASRRLRRRRLVHHVIRYEQLDEDLPRLLQWYGLQNLTMPAKPAAPTQQAPAAAALTPESLSPQSRLLIQSIYREDFVAFGYPL